ncbi:hypothetical protein NDU88_003655 [Pleurodeles waltl]|uniref:Uncharacterized protein n=1 Tax=Pleurodeles waltl TaxID=8319 RepID=A0AAV7W848_PLEWA|nr:hypothetical protein NDU88_003655 [Pleurodeles waltl]
MTRVFLPAQESTMGEMHCKLPAFYWYCGNCREDQKYLVGTQEAHRCKEKPIIVKEDQLKDRQLSTVDMCFLDYLGKAQMVVDSLHVLPGLPV